MKHKVSELEGALLDAAVAMAEGWTWRLDERDVWQFKRSDGSNQTGTWWVMNRTLPVPFLDDWLRVADFTPSTDWAHGGPIIERERIALDWRDRKEWWNNALVSGPAWWATVPGGTPTELGSTALIAAMRAYVSSKLGEEIDI